MRRFFTDRTSPEPDRLARIYDSHASTWLQRESRAENKLTSEQWRNDLIRCLYGDVLEIGVAAGDTLVRLRTKDHAVTSFTGVDISPGMIAQAERAGEGLNIPVDLHTADAKDLGIFADNQFDTVTASLVFCTIPDVPRALAEMARVCKPDGRIVLIEHVLSPNPIVGWLQKLVAPFQIRAMGCHIDRPTIETLQHYGYRVEEQRQRIFGIMRFVIATPPPE